ncbi:SDR family oxidoreductase [Nocardia sp. NPDC051756]|uniref:SDR family oxidoreductase n=1 Tax=Nocardia sp. NPDC051756 TaxID=3154751 RepID=UPI003430698D
MTTVETVPVAIVGMAALMPGSRDLGEFWRNIMAGRDLVTDVPTSRWLIDDYYDPDPAAADKTYCKRGAFMPELPFDPIAHGMPPNTLEATDPSQLLAMLVAEQLIADVQRNLAGPMDRERTGIVLGAGGTGLMGTMDARLQKPVWLTALREAGVPEGQAQDICAGIAAQFVEWQEASFPGLLSNVIAGRVANRFDLHGPNCTVDAACASSLAAISASVNALSLGQADLMFSGGVDALNTPFMYLCFSKTPALSRTGDCRPFSADADGTLLGEGVGMVALKRLADAEAAGDRIYAVIRGIGSSSDGRGKAIYAPAPDGQMRALRRAYAAAGYQPDTVELVEAHGTGTKAGDVAEFAALREVFAAAEPDARNWCALGSIKSQIGHTKAAAGAASIIKTTLALQHNVFPPSIKVDRPNPALDIETSPFYLSTEVRPWVRSADQPRRASLSSFGFGGSNFHATLEEYRPSGNGRAAQTRAVSSAELVLCSADTTDELAVQTEELLSAGTRLPEIARMSRRQFDPAQQIRLAVVAAEVSDLRRHLRQTLAAVTRNPQRSFATGGVSYEFGAADPGPIAFVFPGQGAQYPGMGADVAMAFPVARAVWDRIAGLDLGDTPLHDIVFPRPSTDAQTLTRYAETLTDTRWAQPALAAHSLSLLAVLAQFGVSAHHLAGHSVGELVALHAAGVLDEADLLRLARRRGELIAATEPGGAMLAVTAGRDRVVDAITRAGLVDAWPANLNHRRQTVVSGTESAIATLERAFATAGVTCRRLAVSTGFHSPLVSSAVEPLREFLDTLTIAAPQAHVYANADAQCYPSEPAAIADRVAGHVVAPVRFADEIEAMYRDGVRTFVEVGTGAAVTGMLDEILRDRPHVAVSVDRKGQDGVSALLGALGRLAVHGVPLDFDTAWIQDTEDSCPVRAGAMSVAVNGAAYGHRYPPQNLTTLPPPNPEPPAVRPEPQPDLVLEQRATMTSDQQQPNETHALPAATRQWFDVVAEAQQHTAEAHAAFQQALLTSHQAFLQMAENSLIRLAALGGSGEGVPSLTDPLWQPAPLPDLAVHETTPLPPNEIRSATPPSNASVPASAVGNAPLPPPVTDIAAQPALATAQATLVEAQPAPAPTPTAAAAAPSVDVLLEILAEKTGYPVELLDGEMDLEGELGVDSIKKVEILAAVRKRADWLPAADSPEMAELFKLRTLNSIVAKLSLAGVPAADRDGSPTETISAATATAAEPTAAATRFAVRAVAAPAGGLMLAGLGDTPIIVVDGGSGLADAVVAELTKRGMVATAGTSGPTAAGAVILLSGAALDAGPDAARHALREAFRWARAVAPTMERDGGVFVTVQDTGGGHGHAGTDGARAWFGGLAALTRTAALEWPAVSVKAIDIARADRDPASIAAAIVTELCTGGPTVDVGLAADGTRTTMALIETAAPAFGELPLAAEAVLVVTGGARGVTAAALRELAALARPRLAILGRTPLADEPAGLTAATDEPSLVRALAEQAGSEQLTPARLAATAKAVLAGREVRRNLTQLREIGATVRYLCVDVTDSKGVQKALAEVRRDWGPITGIVHAAGVLADKRIAEKTDEQFEAVVATKVDGLRVLLDATSDDPVGLLCVFSSVAARFGNPGQCDYAMANEVLEHVAVAYGPTRPGCTVRSIAWGPWDGGMVTPALASAFAQRSIPLLPSAVGAAAFTAELRCGKTDIRTICTAGSGRLASAESPIRAKIVFDPVRHAPLGDHVIGGTPVVPIAMVLEWFTALTSAGRSSAATTVLRDLQVLRPATLDEHSALLVEASASAAGRVVDLIGARGQRHYRAHAITDDQPRPVPAAWPASSDRTRLDQAEIYDGSVLFHGPLLHALETVDVGPDGATAQIVGVRGLGWPATDSWCTDPAALDGALQLALVWAHQVLGVAMLPMSLTEFRLHRSGTADGPLECRLRRVEATDSQATCDAILLDPDGEVRAELLGISLVRRPDLG